MIKEPVNEYGLVADLFHDGSGNPRKTIIMVGGSEGGKFWSGRWTSGLLRRLVVQKHTVLSLAYFKEPNLPGSLQEIPMEYFERAFNWLAVRAEVVPDTYALIGGSRGAELVLLLGSKYPQIKAVVGLGPSHVVWQGIPAKRFDLGKDVVSSWSFQGQALPFVPYSLRRKDLLSLITLRLKDIHQEALQDKTRVNEAAIPVEKIQGAILLLSGERDQTWPATYMSEQVMARLKAKTFSHPHEHIAYDTGLGGLIRNKDCWRTVFAFLGENFA